MMTETESRLGMPIPPLAELLDAEHRSAFVIRNCRAMIDVAEALRTAGDGSGANEMLKSVLPLLLREMFLRHSPKESTQRSPGELLQILRAKHRISRDQMDQLCAASVSLGPWSGGSASTRQALRAARLLLALATDPETSVDMGSQFSEIATVQTDQPARQQEASPQPKDAQVGVQSAVDAITSGLAVLTGLLQKEVE